MSAPNGDTHRARVDRRTEHPREILLVAANPAVNEHGWPVGFWGAELTHPYYELTEAGFRVTIASPAGGEVVMDGLSDPRDPSKWSAEDLITMGFVNTPELTQLLADTPALDSLDPGRYEALLIAGGQAPMFGYRDSKPLHQVIRAFWDAEKIVAAYCHGVAALVDCELTDGTPLVRGRTVTAFSNAEEDYSNAAAGVRLMPWRLEDALRERGAHFVSAGLFKPFAVRDGRLITGQQQYSSREVARAVLAAIGV
ncbi:type 1 glutamine amidotransferase domain-containing protein [Streptomyces sp. A7024]|uniref:Type 1 glutamine amidotransferase domain-containing protein n=1 Tax=Streptomyces coryli TaxID=1128680 RepID=A0A6G4TV06_9ACTN|nr:type 1 glutamine amidotransferase domain-containing protein [Streptomyces coryli]NGN62821.1 type 1 glutamine amidotransferase domain-containing protein [Streptomyces coryli]